MHSPNDSATIRLRLLGSLDARTSNGTPLAELVNQPKRLAFIIYLALAPEGRARRRDDLLAMFFPESSEGPARNALNQTVYRLRAVMGEDAILSNEQEIRINRERVWSDAAALRDAAANQDDAQVLGLYRGALLEAFHARGTSNEFEQWLAHERDELREMAVRSAWRASDADAAAGNLIGAAEWGRAAVRFDPFEESSVQRLMLLLEGMGDRGGALRAFDDYSRRLADEFELPPAKELTRLATSLRERPAPLPVPAVVFDGPIPRKAGRQWIGRAALVAAGAALTILGAALLLRDPGSPIPVLAVGDISVAATSDTLLPVELLLSTNLARIGGLSIITGERVREVSTQLAHAGRTDANRTRAAFQAGADEVVEGVLSQRGDTYRLDFRRVDRRARTASGHVVEANDLHDLLDLATEYVAKDLGLRAPASRADGRTASLVAYRLYQQGLTAFYSDDDVAANRLFSAALNEDSMFAMAAYRLAVVTSEDRELLFAKSRRLAASSPLRERLLITAQAMLAISEPGALAVAESLTTRYSADPEGLMVYGKALSQQSRWVDAAAAFQRAADLDSLSIHTSEPRCRACEAHRLMREAYMAADSTATAERKAREWVRDNPQSPYAWSELGQTLEELERFDEAEAAFLRAGIPHKNRSMTNIWIRQLRFADVDLTWQNDLRTGNETVRKNAHWDAYISMRTQGRLRDALVHARAYRDLQGDSLLEGLALFDLGRYHEAAQIHEKHAARWAGQVRPVYARRYAWHLAHAAASYAALRDTAMLRTLEDTVRVYGARSASKRDQLLYHYVRGLRLRVQGREREAARAFENSITALSFGYVREPLQLAYASLASDDPRRAIEALRAALRGPIGSTGVYASRTDLMELLGDAYLRNQQSDSAAALYERVLVSWENADATFEPRVRSLRARLAVLKPG